MTKADIVNEISKDLGLEKRLVLEVVEAFMENVRNSLIENNPVYLRGFGSFITKKRATKVARISQRIQQLLFLSTTSQHSSLQRAS